MELIDEKIFKKFQLLPGLVLFLAEANFIYLYNFD